MSSLKPGAKTMPAREMKKAVSPPAALRAANSFLIRSMQPAQRTRRVKARAGIEVPSGLL